MHTAHNATMNTGLGMRAQRPRTRHLLVMPRSSAARMMETSAHPAALVTSVFSRIVPMAVLRRRGNVSWCARMLCCRRS